MVNLEHGTIALVGAGEYLPKMLPVDKLLLERLGTTPRVVVLPTAAVPDGPTVTERWAQMGIEHFRKLGAQVESVMLLTRSDAERTDIVSQLAAANFIYFSGGKPAYILETLKETTAWRTITDIYMAGGVIAGCSAGAMALGSALFSIPFVWRTRPALGLVPGICVIPHFDELPSFLSNAAARAARKLTVVGIDGGTALVRSPIEWTVQGSGGVTIFSQKGKVCYTAGQQVPLAHLYSTAQR